MTKNTKRMGNGKKGEKETLKNKKLKTLWSYIQPNTLKHRYKYETGRQGPARHAFYPQNELMNFGQQPFLGCLPLCAGTLVYFSVHLVLNYGIFY